MGVILTGKGKEYPKIEPKIAPIKKASQEVALKIWVYIVIVMHAANIRINEYT